MLLLMDATLMRGDDARRIQLCDMFYKLVEQTRPHSGFAFGTVTDQGKVNRVSDMSVAASRTQCVNCAANTCKVMGLTTQAICRMAERSLLGSLDIGTHFNVVLGLPLDGCCGGMSLWISRHTQTWQAVGLGKLV